jgi:hypothetical protein
VGPQPPNHQKKIINGGLFIPTSKPQTLAKSVAPTLTLVADGATVGAEEAQGASPGERGARAQDPREAQLVGGGAAGRRSLGAPGGRALRRLPWRLPRQGALPNPR